MGLRAKLLDWILGDYIEEKVSKSGISSEVLAEVANLREKVVVLEGRLDKIEDGIANWRQQSENGKIAIEEVSSKIEELAREIAKIKESLKNTSSSESEDEEGLEELERKVLEMIHQGYSTPAKLRQALGVPSSKLQRVLDNLIKAKLIEREKKGRRIILVPTSDGG